MPARNYFSQGGASEIIGAGNDAFDRQTALYDDVNARYTATRAGRRMAQGDRMGASREFANAGLLDEARVLESDQVAADTRMRADQDRTEAAAKAKRDEAAAAAKAQAEAMVAILGRMPQVPKGQRKAVFTRARPILENAGYAPEVLAQFDAMTEDDFSDEAIMIATGEAQKAFDQISGDLEKGIFGVKGGRVTVLREPTPQDRVLKPDDLLVDGDGKVKARGGAKTSAPGRPRAGANLPPPPSGWRPVGT